MGSNSVDSTLCFRCGHGNANHERTPGTLGMTVLCRSCLGKAAWHAFEPMSEAAAKIDAERIRWFKQVLNGLHEPRASKCVFHGHLSACVCAPRYEMLAALDALLAANEEIAELRSNANGTHESATVKIRSLEVELAKRTEERDELRDPGGDYIFSLEKKLTAQAERIAVLESEVAAWQAAKAEHVQDLRDADERVATFEKALAKAQAFLIRASHAASGAGLPGCDLFAREIGEWIVEAAALASTGKRSPGGWDLTQEPPERDDE